MYNHNLIEKKWQEYWKKNKTFKFDDNSSKPKFYVLDMFPYPSGKGLHVGHPKGYSATDVISRYKRLKGFSVLHPIGWDAFGLPAEQYAIDTNNHPKDFTYKNIDVFRSQLQSLGFDYDYDKEVNTTDPNYFQWTQWIFSKLYENNLAEIRDTEVNWCDALKTTLSNEEVLIDKNGNTVSERGNHPVIKKNMKQWVLKITAYADKLLDGLEEVDWPESLKNLQRNWIGKTEGYKIKFNIDNSDQSLDVFTSRIDTIFGVSFVAIGKDHPMLEQIIAKAKNKDYIIKYIEDLNKRTDRSILSNNEKTGIFLDTYAINPINNKKVPVYLADYILNNGTCCIMGVPAHCKNDFYFAKKYNLDITKVIENEHELPYEKDGKHINSSFVNGLNIQDATNKIVEFFNNQKIKVQKMTTYKLRDWIFSRQRYWGEPFPILFDESGNISLENNLPLLLPACDDFKPSEDGQSPLAKINDFINVTINGKKYKRESNTMPQWAGSCWYYLGYLLKQTDGKYLALNSKEAYEIFKRWLPVDIYIGGQEHAVLHLLYARFWHRFLYDIKVVPTKEPFMKIINQGMILGEDGQKMSKSKGNIINPNDILASHGADALRLYEMFMGPLTATLPWTNEGLNGMRKWLDRVYRYFESEDKKEVSFKELDQEFLVAYNKFIYSFENNIEHQQFNLAISDMMIFMNYLYKTNVKNKDISKNFLITLSIFAPHLAEELNSMMGNDTSICLQSFPVYDQHYLQEAKINVPFQLNGKNKLILKLQKDLSIDQIEKEIKNNKEIQQLLIDKVIIKKVIVPNKIINYLVR